MRVRNITLALALGVLASTSALATLHVAASTTGPSTVGDDVNHGKLLRVISKGEGNDWVTLGASPFIGFVCTTPAPGESACQAYIKPGTVVHLSIHRNMVGGVRVVATPPTSKQWQGACLGNVGGTCKLTMSDTRVVVVDWSIK